MVKIVKKITRGDVSKAVLQTIKAAGILSVMLVAPNAMQMFGNRGLLNLNKRQKGIINNARDRLVKDGNLERDSRGFLSLTEKGKEKLRQYELSEYKLIIPKVWDKKWRVLIFDIPEYIRPLRDKIRLTLMSIGFMRIQDSVWIFPYDCEELVALLKADFKVGKDLLYLVVEKIENDKQIRKLFHL